MTAYLAGVVTGVLATITAAAVSLALWEVRSETRRETFLQQRARHVGES